MPLVKGNVGLPLQRVSIETDDFDQTGKGMRGLVRLLQWRKTEAGPGTTF